MPTGQHGENLRTRKIAAVVIAVLGGLLATFLAIAFLAGDPTRDPPSTNVLLTATTSPSSSGATTEDTTATSTSTSGTGTTASPAASRTTKPNSSAKVVTTSGPVTHGNGPCTGNFAVASPAEMTRISASGGVTFSGTACTNDLIWILDFDPTDDHYYQTNEDALNISAGKWQFHNAPIGNEGDEPGTVYPIVVIRASETCSAALRGMPADNEGTVRFTPLPASCPKSGSADHKTVHVVNDGP
ncbi:hypothetical protein SAMN04488564_103624 [Lentzea waywayandensis]|uniref:Uncharacterized protein n=1 Tax=Lentzea waywayandensis TaxID=84724 RepID=A0A1I6E1U4_9PSEU|nr:hypothetical protein [Lentzea waywayandensis]SFR11665.1 hypothetical protein SAMN04488564_103624 [Lentzea waywayandensis]